MPESVGRGINQSEVSISCAGGSCGTQSLMACMELVHGTLDCDAPAEHVVAMVGYAAQVHAITAKFRRFAWSNPYVQHHCLHLEEMLGSRMGRPTHVRSSVEDLTRLLSLMPKRGGRGQRHHDRHEEQRKQRQARCTSFFGGATCKRRQVG